MLLPARRSASAGTSYGPVSVCLSVCLSQVGVLSKLMNESSSWFLTRELSLTYPTLCCKEIQVPSIQGFIPSGTLPQTLRLRKFRDSISIVEACYRLSSRKMDAQSVTNWAVVSQLSRYYLRSPTLDHCNLSHRSSSSVYSTIMSRESISDSRYLSGY